MSPLPENFDRGNGDKSDLDMKSKDLLEMASKHDLLDR
jgi:hypothetical protein